MIGETNINGGAGLNGKGALLKIQSQTGSTITVSKGSYSKTIKVSCLDSDNDKFSYWLFQTTNFGEWTVTATLGTDTISNTVTIDSNKQYNVKLMFRYYLFKSEIGGVIPLSSDHEAFASISIGTSEISVNYTSDRFYQIFCCNTNAIDLSGFSVLCVEGIITERQTDSQYGGCVAVASSMMVAADDSTSSKYVAKTSILTGPSTQTTVLDISSIDISGYIGIRGGMRGTISAIYLE